MKQLILRGILATSMIGGLMGYSSSATANEVKIGFVTTLTTTAAVVGNEMRNGAQLAYDLLGGKAGDLNINLMFEDDGLAPEIGKQVTDKLVKQEDVDFVVGYIWSHVLLASRKSVLDAGKFMISANAGASQVAGKLCHENFFSTSWQNGQPPMALGEVLNQRGVNSIYIMAPNYAAGRDVVAGIEHAYKGEVLGKDMTKWGADIQMDFSAELAKAKASGAEGLVVFYPGGAGAAFVKQYHQAGFNETLPLYTVFSIDAIALPKLQAAGYNQILGTHTTNHWDPNLDNAANKEFVAAYRKAYGSYPSFYAAQSYDAIRMVAAAVEAVDGDLENKDGIRAAMKSVNYESVRGDYRYGNNHMPIQDFYLREFVVDEDGNWTTKLVKKVFDDHQDLYAKDCPL